MKLKYNQIWACWGMFLCSTGRFLQEANAANWDTSRWRSMCSKVQGPTAAASMQISVTFNNGVDSFLAGCTVVRPSIFRALKELSDDSSVGSICSVVLINLEWYQLRNFYMITEILIKNHPYFLLWRDIAKHLIDYVKVAEELLQEQDNYKYYKYMRPDIERNRFNNHGIKYLANIARQIAITCGQNSFQNFKVGEQVPDIPNKVKELITLTTNSDFAWSNYSRKHILPIEKENDAFYNTLYSSGSNLKLVEGLITKEEVES